MGREPRGWLRRKKKGCLKQNTVFSELSRTFYFKSCIYSQKKLALCNIWNDNVLEVSKLGLIPKRNDPILFSNRTEKNYICSLRSMPFSPNYLHPTAWQLIRTRTRVHTYTCTCTHMREHTRLHTELTHMYTQSSHAPRVKRKESWHAQTTYVLPSLPCVTWSHYFTKETNEQNPFRVHPN